MLVREDARVSTLDLVCMHARYSPFRIETMRIPDRGVRRCENNVSTAGLLC